jgi:hypothetical protein
MFKGIISVDMFVRASALKLGVTLAKKILNRKRKMHITYLNKI